MKLTIDRGKWLRGEGADRSRLLREVDGKMCCIGFYALALGINSSDILEKYTLENVLGEGCGSFMELYEENDDQDIDDNEREAEIIRLFAEHDVEVTFV